MIMTGLHHMTQRKKISMSTTDDLFLEFYDIWLCCGHVFDMSTTFLIKHWTTSKRWKTKTRLAQVAMLVNWMMVMLTFIEVSTFLRLSNDFPCRSHAFWFSWIWWDVAKHIDCDLVGNWSPNHTGTKWDRNKPESWLSKRHYHPRWA